MNLWTKRQVVRVTLKELEFQSFDITSGEVLKQLLAELQALKVKHQTGVRLPAHLQLLCSQLVLSYFRIELFVGEVWIQV